MDVVEAGSRRIAYRRAGTGPPIVLAHAAAYDGRLWAPQLEGLSDEFTVVAWDEPGAGESSDVPDDFTLADYADDLARVIEAVGLGPAHVGGLSWGGTVALELYRQRPDLVATLLMIDTYAGWGGSLDADEIRSRVTGAKRMLEVPPGEFDPAVPGLFADGPPARFTALLEAMNAAVRPDAMRVALGVMAEADLRDVLPTVTVPALLLWGELDARSPLAVARQFQAAMPAAELVVIPGAGHVSNLERPEHVNEAVRAFCRAHPPG